MRAGGEGRGRVGLAACLGAEVVAGAVGFLVAVHLARRLGPDGMGTLEVATALAGWALVLVRGGIDGIVVREAARRPRLIPRLTVLAIALRVAWAAVGLGLIAAIAVIAGPGRAGPIVAAGLVLIPSAFVADVGPRARGESLLLAGLQSLRALGLAATALILVARPGDLIAAALAPAAGETLVALACLVHAGSRPSLRLTRRAAVVFTRRAAVAGLIRFGRVGLWAADALALGWVSGPGAGDYAVGRRVLFALASVGLVVPTLLGPALARERARGRGRGVGRGVGLILALSAPAALGLALTADRASPWLFGPAYRGGGAVVLIAARLPILLLAAWFQVALVAIGEEGRALRLVVGSAVLATLIVPAAAVAVGPIGLGAAALGVEAVAAVGGWAVLRRAGVAPIAVPGAGAVALGCLALATAVRAASPLALPWTCLAGAAGYGIGWTLATWGAGRRPISLPIGNVGAGVGR